MTDKKSKLHNKIHLYNNLYELVDESLRPTVTLKYLPTGEEFKCDVYNFLKGKASAPSIVKEVRMKKAKQTCLAKYGVENPMKNKEVQERAKKTNQDRYGGNSPSNSEIIRDKQIRTNLEKYGVECSLQNKEVQEKAKKTNLEKYGVENLFQLQTSRDKALQSKIDRGITRRINGKSIAEISKDKNISYDHVNKLIRQGIDIVSYEKSDGTQIEQSVKSILEQLGLKFEREKMFNNGKIRVDFYLAEFNLVVEANGIYWHSDKVKNKDYHYNRRKSLNELGLKVIQFNELEILEDPIRIKYMIKDMIESGGKESYIYEDGYIIVNLDYSIPPEGEILEEWIEECEIKGYKIFNSGVLKIKS